MEQFFWSLTSAIVVPTDVKPIYNSFGSIRDSGCVKAHDTRNWENYHGPLTFIVRAELTEEVGCNGEVIFDDHRFVEINSAAAIRSAGVTLSTD